MPLVTSKVTELSGGVKKKQKTNKQVDAQYRVGTS